MVFGHWHSLSVLFQVQVLHRDLGGWLGRLRDSAHRRAARAFCKEALDGVLKDPVRTEWNSGGLGSGERRGIRVV